MNVEVVLTQDDRSLGKRGDVVKVSSGYANNFLIPSKKALLATSASLKNFEAEKARYAKHEADALARAHEAATKIERVSVRVEVLTGEGDKLYGAVTAQDVQEALAKQGIPVERKTLHLEEPIRRLGDYEIAVKLHPGVKAMLKIQVTKKKA